MVIWWDSSRKQFGHLGRIPDNLGRGDVVVAHLDCRTASVGNGVGLELLAILLVLAR